MQQQAASGELGPGAVLDGGDTDTERRATYLELSLSLAGGLDAAALDTLYKAARPGIHEREPAVQKKSYKVGAASLLGAELFAPVAMGVAMWW